MKYDIYLKLESGLSVLNYDFLLLLLCYASLLYTDKMEAFKLIFTQFL